VEFGEHPDGAVLRELEEETGLFGRAESIALIDSYVVDRPVTRPGPLHNVSILYRVAVIGGELRPESDGSTDLCAWLGPDELATVPRLPLLDQALRVLGMPV
jgi:ADP-ribose pyrophosphatase YjhB (NUDIX family)